MDQLGHFTECIKQGTHLEVGSYGAPAHVDQLGHVIERIEGPHTALQVQVSVQLDGLRLPDAWVKLEGAIIAGAQGRAVETCVIQEPCLCRGEQGTVTWSELARSWVKGRLVSCSSQTMAGSPLESQCAVRLRGELVNG